MLDLHFAGRLPPRGFVSQEDVPFAEFLGNRFGSYYDVGARKLASEFSP